MFNGPIYVKVKKVLIIKKQKMLSYGKKGEFAVGGLKLRYYSMFPTKLVKYLSVTSISLTWSPTISHLLKSSKLTIKAKDSRSASGNDHGKALISVERGADEYWSITMESSINIPIAEMKKGLPILFDIEIPAENVKSNCEIGTLKIQFFLKSSDKAVESFVDIPSQIKNVPARHSVSEKELIAMRKSPYKGNLTSQVDTVVKDYFSGAYSYAEMCEKIRLLSTLSTI